MSVDNSAAPEGRARELVAAAGDVFARQSVADTTVSDIVETAGVAKGTFYLYFDSKDEIINAVAERIAGGMVDAIEEAVGAATSGALAKFDALRETMVASARDPDHRELIEIYHRPENRAVHDRMAERITARLVPLLEDIIEQGIEEEVFAVEEPRRAAWFVLGGLHAFEKAFPDREEFAEALEDAFDLARRTLEYPDARSPDE